MNKKDVLSFQEQQLANLIQRVGEELDEAMDLQLSSVCVIDSEEYKILQKKICDLSDRYDRLTRLYDERFNKPEVKEPETKWYDDGRGKIVAAVAGAGLMWLGNHAMMKESIRLQNEGNFVNDRMIKNDWSGFLKKIF